MAIVMDIRSSQSNAVEMEWKVCAVLFQVDLPKITLFSVKQAGADSALTGVKNDQRLEQNVVESWSR